MRLIGYAPEEAEVGPLRQEFRTLYGFEIDEVATEEIGIAGGPTLRVLLGGLRNADVVVVRSLAHIGNSISDVAKALDRAKRKGAAFQILKPEILTSSPMGVGFALAFSIAAEMETYAATERWARDIEAARRQGAYKIGRPKVIKTAVVAELRAQGLGGNEIARRLDVSRQTVWRKLKEMESGAQTAKAAVRGRAKATADETDTAANLTSSDVRGRAAVGDQTKPRRR